MPDPASPRERENCERKIRYSSEREARAAAGEQMRIDPAAPKLRVYQCRVCGGWHLTSGSRGLDDKLREAFGGG